MVRDDVNGKRSNDDFSRTLNDVTDQFERLLTPKWVVDDDTYNLDAFDQCEGLWPPEKPLPLPMWSNDRKKPFVVENVSVSVCFWFYFRFASEPILNLQPYNILLFVYLLHSCIRYVNTRI